MFHIDDLFACCGLRRNLAAVEIGGHAQWAAAGLSDHAPVIATFGPGTPLAGNTS